LKFKEKIFLITIEVQRELVITLKQFKQRLDFLIAAG